jgi:hypothetical protein
MGRTARALRQRRLGRAVASRGRRSACRPAEIAMRRRRHTRRPLSTARPLRQRGPGRAVASRGRHGGACPSRRDPAKHRKWHTSGQHGARPPQGPVWGGAVASRGQHSACSSHRSHDALPATHTWAAQHAPSASAGWGGRSRRVGGTAPLSARASPAAIMIAMRPMRRRRHTHGRTACVLRQRRLGRAIASCWRHSTWSWGCPAAGLPRDRRRSGAAKRAPCRSAGGAGIGRMYCLE